jgi:alpha-L-fucosidase
MRGRFEPTWESLKQYRAPKWYVDGKFGIFIHWGVYAVPAFGNEWYPRNMYQQGTPEFEHHLATYGPHAQFGYKDFIPQFRAERYDAGRWADLFIRSGAKYVVPVAEHHDGFAMYDSALSNWTAAKMGPCRDVVGELAAAVRERGLVFGVSSHRAEHWWFMDGGRKFPSDVQDPRYQDFYGPAQPAPADFASLDQGAPDEAYLEDWLTRTCELVDAYRPQLVWFDWWIQQRAFAPYLQRFAAHYYNRGDEWGLGVAINHKFDAFPEGTAVFDVERGQLSETRASFWQTDTAICMNSWGYVKDRQYKTPTSVLHDLVDIVSKNGSLLLNIGPRPDGTIPEEEEQTLLAIGAWLSVNGEAVYGTRPWRVYGEGPTAVEGGTFNDTKRGAFTSEDVRFTSKGEALYATCFGWPESKGEGGPAWTIRTLKPEAGRVTAASLLGSAEPLRWSQGAEGLRVEAPAARPCEHAYTLKLSLAK